RSARGAGSGRTGTSRGSRSGCTAAIGIAIGPGRRRRRASAGGGYGEERLELSLVDHAHALLLGVVDLRPAGVGAAPEGCPLLRPASGDLAAGALDAADDLLARARQRAGDDERALEMAARDLGLDGVDAERAQLVDDPPVLGVGEEARHRAG